MHFSVHQKAAAWLLLGFICTGLCACSKQKITASEEAPTVHEHTYSQTLTVKATCTENGLSYRECSCGLRSDEEVIYAKGHSYEEQEGTPATCLQSGSIVYVCSVCGVTKTEKSAMLSHAYVYDVCTLCGNSAPTEGIAYTLAESGTYYIVSGMGECQSSYVVIAATYNGLPVQQIAANAFSQNTNLTSVTIPSTVTQIGACAFKGCTNLTSLFLDGLTPAYDWRYTAGGSEYSLQTLMQTPKTAADALTKTHYFYTFTRT